MLEDSRIRSYRGTPGSDETAPYHISFNEPITVRDFINAQLKDTREFGCIDIYSSENYDGRLSRHIGSLSYDRGKITGGRIPNNLYDMVVIRAGGSGGWGRSDFNVVIDVNKHIKEQKNIQEINIDLVGKDNKKKDNPELEYDTKVTIEIGIARRALRLAGAINPFNDKISDEEIIKILKEHLKDYGVTIKGFN